MSSAQLALALRLDAHAAFETLADGRNEAAFSHVRALAGGESGDIVWLFGPRGCGKSHVLQAACRAADLAGKRAMYLPLGPDVEPDLLGGLEALEFLALDGIELVAGASEWESRLFAVLNGFQSRERTLLLAANDAPAALPFALPDLASRAAGSVVYRLHPLGEEEQVVALQRHARHRGLELTAHAAVFLQTRVPRDIAALCAWLDRLDERALAAQRKLTIPFIREALGEDRPA